LLGAAAASLALVKSLEGEVARAAAGSAEAADVLASVADRLPRGADGRHVRLGTLDLEGEQDFTAGFRIMLNRRIRTAAYAAFDRVLEREGLDPSTPLSVEQLRALVEQEPGIYMLARTWLSNQQVTWNTLRAHFHEHADRYLDEMEAADRQGPGKLELSPQMDVPRYTRHEIHIQPGGYVGDPFAGHMYQYGTNSFYMGGRGHNEQDQIHRGAASRVPLPPDGKVRRILDAGCGVGQMSCAMKERFPEAEVWGIDIGAPMVRYAHLRANRLGIGVNFAQRLAEESGFPDGHFDIVTSYIMHHELPADRTLAVIEETRRVTRAGGVYYPLDFVSGGLSMPARQMFGRWYDHRWNNEVWSLEYHSLDFSAEIARRGFRQDTTTKPVLAGFGHRHFVRLA
jgi:ubiquinone/menaquinone biosynthesis C-methylase UbiE